ncbi:unnamed protein product [Leptidea sinapis]|uniref:Uncharacterized protein n=1 Tax=Leptidea sinapis TaxID=189913 RepID=A0A5E4QRT1_9NEOP|nr:unnamed protein product [Leptidea sinapis]
MDNEDVDIDRTLWGELESESEEESEDEESDEEKVGEGEVATGVATPGEGLVTPLGISSVPPGMETPDTIELRKKKLDTDLEGDVEGGSVSTTGTVEVTLDPSELELEPEANKRKRQQNTDAKQAKKYKEFKF